MKELILKYVVEIFSFDSAHPLLFTQFYFWAFFAVVFAGLCLLRNKVLLRNAFIFFASLFFYFKTSGLFLLLLLFVIFLNYSLALWLRKVEKGRKAILLAAILADLFCLCYYKYAYFFTDIVNNLLGSSFVVRDIFAETGNRIAGAPRFNVDSILLPVGISFFVFQAISYVTDVYRRRVEPIRNVFDFGFYLSFFPQLVAGPIVRADKFIPQLHKPFFLGRRQFGIAVFWILNGLAKKLILSDYIAINLCDRVFANPLLYTGFENLSALFGYSLQVYADFSGYTDIATGVAMLMGFYLPKNFNSPYKARNAGEFWKRWHISLSSWLKDYLYIPLGGNRNGSFCTYAVPIGIGILASVLSRSWWIAIAVGAVALVVGLVALFRRSSRKAIRTNLNRMDTMLLGGLWHGASWNFMIWGGLNGLGMLIYQAWKGRSAGARVVITLISTYITGMLTLIFGYPVFRLFFWWSLFTFAGALVRWLWFLIKSALAHRPGTQKIRFGWLGNAWAVLQTFVFITFTRLFFRSGSNLDPAEANEVAWSTAKNMVNQIGGQWNLQIIPQILQQYSTVFILIALGMIIHWLPERFKRRYRICFASLPLPLMALAVVLAVFILYQFTTAGLLSFIYFQF